MKKSYHSMLDAASDVMATLAMLILAGGAPAAAVMVSLSPSIARRCPALGRRPNPVPPPSEDPEEEVRQSGVRPRVLAGLGGQPAGEFGHVVEVGLEGAQALGQAAQFRDQVLALRLRQVGLDPLPAAPVLARREAEDLAPPRGERRGDVRGAGRRRIDRQLLDRLQEDGAALGQALLHRQAPGHPEGHFGGIDAVGLALYQGDLQVRDREAELALLQAVADALLDGGDPLLGDRAADHLLAEDEAGAA